MQDDSNRVIGIIIIFAIIALTTIADRAIRLVERLTEKKAPVVQSISTPKVSLPNPQQYYFIDCADGERGIIIDKKGNTWYYTCKKGEWEGSNPL